MEELLQLQMFLMHWVVPRKPERFDEVADLLSHQKLRSIKKTKIKMGQKSNHHDIILLDTIGELSKLYSIGTIIFVGGSLVSTGGHNVLEPVAYKKAVIVWLLQINSFQHLQSK